MFFSNTDNPFATAYPYVDSVFNAMNALAIIARECGGVDKLHALITAWHQSPSAAHAPLPGNPVWAADACILIFGVVYPNSHAVAKPIVPECYSKALPFLARTLRGENEFEHHGRLFECVPATSAGDLLWERFSTRPGHLCPWKVGIAPLLSLILRKQGAHSNTLEEIGEFRNALNTLCSKAAWLAYSKDGIQPPATPNPASMCATMNDVRRPTLDPVFFTRGDNLEMGDQRGALVGIHPFQLRQLYSLMLGAHLDKVHEVQVVRNEGMHRHSNTPLNKVVICLTAPDQVGSCCARARCPRSSSRTARSGLPKESRIRK